ncbi:MULTISPECIES: GGDEF domain-containing protein [unclassified Pseudomonas]|uniref:GGDEF domain-containing protein n=1 Tax=unclassified Pseudomonas TaxID=196821 RepID=UPI0024488892|nr:MULTISPECIES: GGDEF domain-containing protein [unclassified Pseudomonas]MDG9929776.1 GGDEF domain-containing protein [Pseudomonas sp. GD04042]MDH0485004.1 GGDEF domain-containing protein [Pseudomonas sp. GD04015]MDH0606727.1 GGDEF domain-containing protein [Pseudomonas sp. GD03869]
MPRLAAYRPHHLLTALPLLVAGLVVARMDSLSEFFQSLFNVLPTLLLLLGGAFCVAYGRQREFSLLVVVYLVYFLLDTQTDHFREHGQVREDAALVFHLCSLLLPLFYGLYGAWRERSHLLQDMVARAAVLLAVGGTFAALARRFPEGLQAWLAQIHWPLWHGQWMSLIQLAYPLFLIAGALLLVQYLRQPRPVHAALFLGLLGLLWMLPNTFILPHALQVMSSLVMLMLVAAVVHEAYQMAYRDELTGLPGRRALNDRLERLGRNYVIAMADVDHFKKFNDTHGHDVGDQVLRLVASRLRRVGGGGKAYRYGGEEFTLVFPGKTLDECRPYLEAVREAVESYPLQLRDKQQRPASDKEGRQRRTAGSAPTVSVTISIGMAEREAHQRGADEVIRSADKALYAAKQAGRNRVMAQGESRRGAVRVKSPAA